LEQSDGSHRQPSYHRFNRRFYNRFNSLIFHPR
jgi:hypothetical protein